MVAMNALKRMKKAKNLIAFDFDGTLCQKNSSSQYVSRRLAPSKPEFDALLEEYQGRNWLEFWGEYTNKCHRFLHHRGVTISDYERECNELKLIEGIVDLIQFLCADANDIEAAIISDCNSLFIDWVLRANGVNLDVFTEIIAPPGVMGANGCLQVRNYHEDQNWCSMSSKSLCKGRALTDLRNSFPTGTRVVYVGDSENDVCPSLTLKNNDFVLPRHGYPLESEIEARKDIRANVIPWVDGHDIKAVITKLMDGKY